MLSVLRTTWPLFLGILLLMVGNGMQGTLLGIRGGIEGIPTFQMSVAMSGYYAGFLLGPPVIGFVAEAVGLRAALGVPLLAAVAVLVLGRDGGRTGGRRVRAAPPA